MNSVEIKSEEAAADAPVIEGKETTPAPEIEVYDQMGVPTARPKVEEEVNEETRPDWLPEKFKSASDLAKAYSELEKKLSGGTAEEEEEETTEPETEEPKTEEPKTEDKSSKDFSKYSEEWAETGKLSEGSYKELQGMGIPKAFIDRYVEGVEAVQSRQVNEIYSSVGGEENYKAMTEWAANNLPKEDIAAYDAMVTTTDINKVKLASKGLWAQYTAANGKQPKLIGGSQSSRNESTAPFRSTAEVVTAMSNPKYATDSAYRKDVERRLAISDVI